MATWYDNSADGALDKLLIQIRDTCTFVWLLSGYSAADNWATVSANKVGEAAINNSNFSGIGAGGAANSRQITFSGVTGSATATSTGNNLHMAIVDTTNSKVLAVTNETTNVDIADGADLTFPSFYLQVNQPTQA